MKASLRCWFCDVTALAWSWTSSDGWFQGESPADRLPGRELREQEESPGAQERERGRASSFELSGFGHRPQAAGRIRVSVWCRALPM